MPALNVNRQLLINAPVDKVFHNIFDLGEWMNWSPWLIMDKNTNVSVAADKRSYAWEGNRIGSGNMKVVGHEENKFVKYDLNFLKPYKSHADVTISLSPAEGGTQVNWSMASSLPFFLFFMKKSMEAYIGNDFERGLRLLKDWSEDGRVHSQLNYLGVGEYPGCQYIGMKRSCQAVDASKYMTEDFTALMAYCQGNENTNSEACFSMYHEWDLIKGKVTYTAGVPVKSLPTPLPEGYISGSIPATKIYTLQRVGSYNHLGNAWATLYAMMRNKEFKYRKGIDAFETYGNSPRDTEPGKLITNIHFPVV